MSGVNSTVETVNAAATAFLTADGRVQQVTSPRRRWGGCFSMHWCFGSQKRVTNSSFASEVAVPIPGYLIPDIPMQQPAPVLPFVAPPSSPASFLQSDPPSVSHTPGGLFSLTALSAEAYSPSGPASIFAIGPYAHETQLVSPPVFSTLNTEPSTAPLTPPEPVHLTTPSSPEVPFAELLMSSLDSTLKKNGQGFPSYPWYPGSPIGNLISPNSVCSGTSSPFPDSEVHSFGNGSFSSFPIIDPPKLLSAEGLSMRKILSLSARGDPSRAGDHISANELAECSTYNSHEFDPLLNQRVSFELSNHESKNSEFSIVDKDLALERRVSFELSNEDGSNKKPEAPEKAARELSSAESASEANGLAHKHWKDAIVDDSYHDLPSNVEATREFKFENIDGAPNDSELDATKSWFFHVKQPGTS